MDSEKPSDFSIKLMLEEFNRLRELFIKNEEDGNTRINIFIALTTALMSAFGISSKFRFETSGYSHQDLLAISIVHVGLFILGIFILKRLLNRNIETDEIKEKLDKIREFFKNYDQNLEEFLPYKTPEKPYTYNRIENLKEIFLTLGRGGYAQIVIILNSILIGFIVFMIMSVSNFPDIYFNNNTTADSNESFYKNLIILLSTLISGYSVYIFQRICVSFMYKRYIQLRKKQKRKLDIISNAEKLKKEEHEISLIIFSSNPRELYDELTLEDFIKKNIELEKDFEFLDNYNKLLIIDTYFDYYIENKGLLQEKKYVLRIRKENENYFITLKGPTIVKNSIPVRTEIEEIWTTIPEINQRIIKSMLNEIEKIGLNEKVEINSNILQLPDYLNKPYFILKKLNFKDIQNRNTDRIEFKVIDKNSTNQNNRNLECIKLDLDYVKYYFHNGDFDKNICYYNIELEIVKDIEWNSTYTSLLLHIKESLLLRFPNKIKVWKHSKYATGKALNWILKNNIFYKFDNDDCMTDEDFIKIDKLIKEENFDDNTINQ